ncbi:MAG TPA: long-chain fatty acid--CoA ligase [Polyangium sp.]|nr:long-chain fatty acid--CoA ligase [Polyangium sp.]
MHHTDWLARRAALSPNKIALIDNVREGKTITYRQWNRSANQTAMFLSEKLGVRLGDRVAILALNDVDVLDVWFACAKLGAVFAPLNFRLKSRELVSYLETITPTVLLYGAEFVQVVSELQAEASLSVRAYVALDGGARARGADADFAERLEASDGPTRPVNVRLDEPWVLCGTGGTTGTPKAAMLTYRSITANAVNTVSSFELHPTDVTLLNAPLFHTGGLNVFTAPLVLAGGTSIVCRSFDPEEVLSLVAAKGVSIFFGVPTMFLSLSQSSRFAEGALRSLRICISGGAPCPEPIFHAYWGQGIGLKTGYGLTEAGPNNFWLPPEDVQRKIGSVGAPLFFVEARIVDEFRAEVRPGEVGELELRGPHVFGGYWNAPKATADVLGDGWLRTGDLARRDDDGHVYIAGRSKDLIISGGENVYPAEVEAVLMGHPEVAEAAVIGVPHAKWGQVPRAIIVLRGSSGATQGEEMEAALLGYCRERLAKYKVPESFRFVQSLPRTGPGKVDKKRLEGEWGR